MVRGNRGNNGVALAGGSVSGYATNRALRAFRTVGEFVCVCYSIEMEDQKAEYSFEELAVWRTKLPKAKHAILPPHTNRPNPLIHKDTLFVSIFSSGAVCALDAKNGQMLWRRELPSLGSDSVHLAEAVRQNRYHALRVGTPNGRDYLVLLSVWRFWRNDLFFMGC
jgi:outer membrane protein assembly factor BamB